MTTPRTTPVYLSTPCATPTCGHAYNWHTAGVCTVETCQCGAFATAPARAAGEQPNA